jgi:hypothetical protein
MWRLLTTLLLMRGTLLKMLVLVPILRLVLRALRVLATLPLTDQSQVPLLKALLWIRTLTCVASRALSLHPPLSIHLLVHIV